MAVRPIFEVCARETGCEGEYRLWVPWWMQVAAHKQMKVTVELIFFSVKGADMTVIWKDVNQ